MIKAQKFKSIITSLQIAPPENLEMLLGWILRGETVTFFSWKMFRLKKLKNNLIANPSFDPVEADKYILAERRFVQTLLDLEIKFDYLKLIPDELPKVFFNTSCAREADEFAVDVYRYFNGVYPQTKVTRMTDMLTNPPLRSIYSEAYNQSLATKIDHVKFQKEIVFRSSYYTDKPLSRKTSTQLATKAFGLFAAETTTILAAVRNPVLLAGIRSVDTYKYEFFKYPKDRPVLPKLFVL